MALGFEENIDDNRARYEANYIFIHLNTNSPRTNALGYKFSPQLRRCHWIIPLEIVR
jgi:hypothetical protein